MADLVLRESLKFMIDNVAKITGRPVILSDKDFSATMLPCTVIELETSGDITEFNTKAFSVVIPLSINIRAEEKNPYEAYGIFEKFLKGVNSLRTERGYNIGSGAIASSLENGSFEQSFEDGYFQIAIQFKINEIIQGE